MEEWILSFISDYGYLGVFLLIMLENIFPPIPSEVILTFGGFTTTTTSLTITGVVISSTFGSLIGAIILYRIGTSLDVDRLEKIVDKHGKMLQLKKRDVQRVERWFNYHGIWAVLFCRVIPLLRSLISIPAGMAKMNFKLFLLFTTIGTLTWNLILVNLGASFGYNWHTVATKIDSFSIVVYFAVALLGIGLLGSYFVVRSKRKKSNFM